MKKVLFFFLFLTFFVQLFLVSEVSAQFQDTPFSANDESCASFRCADGSAPAYDSTEQVCKCGDELALLRPPALQQVEIWFVRITYVIWAFVGSLSFILLVYLGYRYILTRGDVTKITEIRQAIINYIIGFCLVFLAVPLLSTFFRLLGVNGEVECYNFAADETVQFQFFFPELCTDPKRVIVSDPCGRGDEADGFACSVRGETYTCDPFSGVFSALGFSGSSGVELSYECEADPDSQTQNAWDFKINGVSVD